MSKSTRTAPQLPATIAEILRLPPPQTRETTMSMRMPDGEMTTLERRIIGRIRRYQRLQDLQAPATVADAEAKMILETLHELTGSDLADHAAAKYAADLRRAAQEVDIGDITPAPGSKLAQMVLRLQRAEADLRRFYELLDWLTRPESAVELSSTEATARDGYGVVKTLWEDSPELAKAIRAFFTDQSMNRPAALSSMVTAPIATLDSEETTIEGEAARIGHYTLQAVTQTFMRLEGTGQEIAPSQRAYVIRYSDRFVKQTLSLPANAASIQNGDVRLTRFSSDTGACCNLWLLPESE